MRVNTDQIVGCLRGLGVVEGDALLVHSSLKSFGHVEGGADAVIEALLEAVGTNGTVMVPTITGQESYGPQNPPVFDVRQSLCWTGAIPEIFRKRAGAVRSLHPTHSVAAIGAEANFFTSGHLESQTPCGLKSPYMKLAESGGKVVLFGVGLQCCTLLHGAEEIAGCDYHLQSEAVTAEITDCDGVQIVRDVRIHRYGTERQFCRLEPMFLEKEIMKKGMIGSSQVRVLDAEPAVEMVLEILKTQPRFLCKD